MKEKTNLESVLSVRLTKLQFEALAISARAHSQKPSQLARKILTEGILNEKKQPKNRN